MKFFPKKLNEIIREKYHQSIRDKKTPRWNRENNYSTSRNIKIGFIGAGNYAKHHLLSLQNIKGVSLDYILTKTGKNSEKIKEDYGFKESFTDIKKFMTRDVDAYFVVSSSNTLFDMSKELFNNGKPMLIEKPPGFTSRQTKELSEIAKKNNTFGMVALNRRYYSDIQHGLAMLADYGPIRGAILEVPEDISNIRGENKLSEIEYKNYFYRNSIHAFDTLRHIMGEIVQLKSLGFSNEENNNRGLSAGAVVEHELNRYSLISTLWDTKPFYWRMKIIGERGCLEFSEKSGTKFLDEKMNVHNISADEVDSSFRKGNFMQTISFIKSVDNNIKPE
ncbi:MAG: Gfo/Idh/MocA family oxidoreductase, partial [SAR202 cluster bacterium]|nr:Gfo/Idh/MocA family oxidoreductase [SAR202 cluster bacterium]